MIISVLIAVGVIIGLVDLIRYFPTIFFATPTDSYQIFQNFLGYTLLLIVAIELMLMIINHSTKAILELILFVIARKMLIYSNTMADLVLGALAIAIVFFISKYLFRTDRDEDIVLRDRETYHIKANLRNFLRMSGINIDNDIENAKNANTNSRKTNVINDLVCKLAKEACQEVEEGAIFETEDFTIEVIKENDGVIEEVKIMGKESLILK